MAAGDITASRAKLSDFPCNVFDGIDDIITVSNTSFNAANDKTVSLWICPITMGESFSGRIFVNGALSTNMSANNTVQVNSGGVGATALASTNGSVPYRTWTHFLFTVTSSGDSNIYINGALNAGPTDTGTPSKSSTINIGNNDGTRTFDGGIREVKAWDRILTTTEITEEYQGTNHPFGLIHYFKLGGDYTDYGSAGITATNSGSTANTIIPNELKTDSDSLNLTTVTDKIVALPVSGRDGRFTIVGANRTP